VTVYYSGPGLGNVATKATGALTAADISLFTIAGGRVMVTSVIGEVTVAVTAANASKLKLNPTVGAVDADLCATLDIGTTDSPVGQLFAITGVPGDAMISAAGLARVQNNYLILAEGVLEQESAGADGEITWTVTWLPYDTGATLVAA
jgi:hypothetical protein